MHEKALKKFNNYYNEYFEAENYIVKGSGCFNPDFNSKAWTREYYHITRNGELVDYRSISSITRQGILDKNNLLKEQLTNKVSCGVTNKVSGVHF